MTLNRNTGLALGFGIGIVIAAVIFGTSWIIKNGGNILKTQTLQNTTPVSEPVNPEPLNVSVPSTPTPASTDTLMNRLVPTQENVVSDIQTNLQELYGAKQ